MRDYSKGKIYHIVCNITGETYYGSTVQKISTRMGGHRNKDNKCLSKPIIERGDYHYGLVEDYKCDNLEQLLMRERYYVDNNYCVNKRSPITSKEEKTAYQKIWHEEHKEEVAAQKKVYNEEHKEEIAAKSKVYYEEHKEEHAAKGKVWREENKEKEAARKKVYQQEHKEEIAANKKVYQQEHKEELAAKKKVYYEEHKEEVAAKGKVYREANREKISARRKAKHLLKKQAEK